MTDKGKERKKLFEGAATDTKPKSRTVDEIKAKYKKSEVISIWIIGIYFFFSE